MTEVASDVSLATRAKRLAALARAKSQDEQESQDQSQIETALDKLDSELASLSAALATYKKLKAIGAPVNDPGDLAKPASRLREQIQTIGRPTPQFLGVRTREVSSARTDISVDNLRSWRSWADSAIRSLPLNLTPRLSITTRSATETRVTRLKKLAASASPPTAGEISEFVLVREHVREDLAAVEGSAVDAVLARFVDGRIRLSDLDEDEIALLRSEASIAQQLFVQLS